MPGELPPEREGLGMPYLAVEQNSSCKLYRLTQAEKAEVERRVADLTTKG